ncbi:MAG: hypothetical protein KF689_14120 [Gemmatimonadaceae bacterium]|nr:hypothetical protein [Gemmatimonadaceae bacterium]MCW5826877.1 hypothetical protein [Gemmatimonadaceae bacterium]
MSRLPCSVICGALLLAAAQACSSDGPAAPAGNTISMSSTSFVPASLTIDATESVTFRNPSGVLHNVTFSTAGSPANVGDHSSGQNSRSFPTAGTFDFSCTNHAGMVGSITVQ